MYHTGIEYKTAKTHPLKKIYNIIFFDWMNSNYFTLLLMEEVNKDIVKLSTPQYVALKGDKHIYTGGYPYHLFSTRTDGIRAASKLDKPATEELFKSLRTVNLESITF